MIKINNREIQKEHFPDGTQMLLNIENTDLTKHFVWKYENDEELVTLMYLTKHFRNLDPYCYMTLTLNYVPNARMDRTKSDKEIFTLKWFCEIINSLKFDKVIIFDPHSYVCEGLLNCVKINNDRLNLNIKYVINETGCNLVYFPDAGALKRYGDMEAFKGIPKIYGKKNRDWKTGEIKGLSILSDDGDVNELTKNSNVLMVDDIISYGGTLYFSALELKKLGVNTINAYVSHTENSVLDENKGKFKKLLDNGTVSKLYTTNSLYNKEYNSIKII